MIHNAECLARLTAIFCRGILPIDVDAVKTIFVHHGNGRVNEGSP